MYQVNIYNGSLTKFINVKALFELVFLTFLYGMSILLIGKSFGSILLEHSKFKQLILILIFRILTYVRYYIGTKVPTMKIGFPLFLSSNKISF